MDFARLLVVPVLLTLVFLPACGGGGGGSSIPEEDGPLTVPYDGPDVQPDGDGGGGSGESSALDQARALWDSQGITDYTYTLQRTAFAPPQYTAAVIVVVRGGQVISQTYQQTGQPVTPLNTAWWPTIDGLFDILQDAYDRNAEVIQVTYDPTYGFPTWANIDYDTGLGDDEHSFGAGTFTPMR
jgi:hypothetical protein